MKKKIKNTKKDKWGYKKNIQSTNIAINNFMRETGYAKNCGTCRNAIPHEVMKCPGCIIEREDEDIDIYLRWMPSKDFCKKIKLKFYNFEEPVLSEFTLATYDISEGKGSFENRYEEIKAGFIRDKECLEQKEMEHYRNRARREIDE